jgi:pyridoxal phosphate-dependent aminotransferase EpsN
MSGAEETLVREAFASNWLSTVGPALEAFERDLSKTVGLPTVALGSGTAAIHLGLRLLGVRPGDTVVSPSLTFVASVNPVRYLGGEPIFIDSERESWNMDPDQLDVLLRRKATRNKLPRAVVVVHLYGQSANLDPILEICGRYGVHVLEDAAEALGTSHNGRQVGSRGLVSAFSFNGNKIITTTGGGALASPRQDFVDKARFWSTQARDPSIAYEHSEMGYNYRLSNVLAAIGQGQLTVLGERVRQRRAVFAQYCDAFADLPGLEPMPQAPWGLHTCWLSCFLLDAKQFGTSRDALIQALAEENIEARPIWKPMHLQPLWRHAERIGGAVAEDLFARGICLPSSSSLTPGQHHRVVQVVRAQHRQGS